MLVHVVGYENGINGRVNCGFILDFVGGLGILYILIYAYEEDVAYTCTNSNLYRYETRPA